MAKRKRRNKALIATLGMGIRIGLIVLTGCFTFRILLSAYEILERRTGAVGGELCIIPLLALLFWAGWTAKREHDEIKEEVKNKKMTTETYMHDARRKAEASLGRAIGAEEWSAILPTAQNKLNRIISREGDADGERRKPYYLGCLVAEAIRASEFAAICEDFISAEVAKIKGTAPSRRQPKTHQNYTAKMLASQSPAEGGIAR